MKKIIVFAIFFLLGLSFLSRAQEKDEIIREEVKVTNIEVPVRVFYKGKPVDTLSRSDFKLYEDGKLQEINGFYLERKKIDVQHFDLKAKERKEIFPARYFVLVFNLVEYNDRLAKGLDYVFNKILRQTDQLLVMVNKEISFYNDLSEKEEIHGRIKNLLKHKGRKSREQMLILLEHIERKVEEYKILKAMNPEIDVERPFLKDFYFTWRIFKKRYLMPTVDEFYYFAKHLEGIKKEKWVINFYQLVKYLQFKSTSEALQGLIALLDSREYHKMNLDLKAETEFPADEVSKLFYKVNATFHSILIPTEISVVSEDLEYKEISTALENCLREISKKTGGSLILSANLVSSLDTIIEKEDIYYMLTYEPQDPKRIGRIKIEVTDKKLNYKIVYDKNIRASYIKDYLAKKEAENPEASIKEMAFKGKKLSLLIGGFLLKKEKRKKEPAGQLDVHIRIENDKGKIVFDKNRKLAPQNPSASISIDFNWLGNGKYYILSDVRDELTGNSDLEFVQAAVGTDKTTLSRVEFKGEDEEKGAAVTAPAAGSKALGKYLSGAASYCDRLREEAFHFYCDEKVEVILDLSDIAFRTEEESPFWGGVRIRQMGRAQRLKAGKKNVKVFHFDYQIISAKGIVTEQRKLTPDNVNDAGEEKELKGEINSFLTERAVFGPITLLSKERQDKFNFKLVKYEKYKKRRYAVIEATPKNKKVNFSYGKVWVDCENFSVKKIKVDPRSITGYKKLLHLARQLQTRLFLSCEIEYNQLHNGLRFPTRVLIAETYRGGPLILRSKGYKGWERSKTIFAYKDYKFFEVETKVKH